MVNIGITGGLGYIGAKLAKTLSDKGHFVRIIDVELPEIKGLSDNPNIDIIQGDILNSSDLERFLDGLDFVYHLAGISNVRVCNNDIKRSLELNVLSTRLLLDKIKNSRIFGMFFPSSIVALYGELKYVPADENHPINPINDYGIMKRSSELFCLAFYRSFGVPVVIGRQSTVYGPSPRMKYDSAIHSFIQKAIRGEKIFIFGSGNQKRNFIYIDDLINGYIKILENIQAGDIIGEIFHLAGNDVVTINDLVRKIVHIVKGQININIEIEYKSAVNEVVARELKISLEKSKKFLDFEPKVSIDKGLEETFSFIYKQLKGGNNGSD